jgi:hypothetical protein
MDILLIILIGLIAGALAGRVVSGHGYGVLGDIVVVSEDGTLAPGGPTPHPIRGPSFMRRRRAGTTAMSLWPTWCCRR